MSEIKLTQLSHGGGCGCKIAPALLQEILGAAKEKLPFANLMVGTETSDDAAVYRLNDQQAIIATTDFFMPIVDDLLWLGMQQVNASYLLAAFAVQYVGLILER